MSEHQTFDKSHHDQTVTVKQGEKFEVVLAGNPTTGYQWEHVPVTEDTAKITKEYGQKPHAPKMVGVGGAYHFTIEAAKNFTFQAVYKRSWEKDAGEPFTLHVVVA